MKNNKRKRAACLLLAFVCVLQLLVVFGLTVTAAGETSSVSGVLDDLKRDPDFKVEDYPENPDDHSVKVIQVAEGSNGELFVYVYRPEGTSNVAHRADSINMSLQDPTNKSVKPSYSRYLLTWLNSNGTLEKYQFPMVAESVAGSISDYVKKHAIALAIGAALGAGGAVGASKAVDAAQDLKQTAHE